MEKNYTFFKKELEDRTEKELELTKIILQRQILARLKTIDNNIQFFFWLTALGLGAYLLFLFYQDSL